MRRELGCVLAIAFVAAAAACGGQKNNAAGAAGTDTTSAAQPAAPGATTTPAGAPAQVTVPPNLPSGVTAAMIEEGNQVFHGAGNCFTCHGQDAKGTSLAPDLTMTPHLWVTTYPTYVDLIKKGVPTPKKHPAPMLPRGGSQITDAQVAAVAAYEWALSHPQGGQ